VRQHGHSGLITLEIKGLERQLGPIADLIGKVHPAEIIISDQTGAFCFQLGNEAMSSTRYQSAINQRREEWLRKIRVEWYRVMRPLGAWLPWDIRDQLTLDDAEIEDYFSPAPTLENIHVQHCRVVPDRFRLLMGCLPTNSICCEVGTDRGLFAKKILELSKPSELHLIDRSFSSFEPADFSSAIASGTVMLHEADSVVALNKFPNGYFDWIYIDGNHSYEGVSRDINAAKDKIKPMGMLAFNDYMFWSHRELMCYGVMQAVNEFCLKEAWEIVYLALNSEASNDVVLRKIP
jgi:hypothetical protein